MPLFVRLSVSDLEASTEWYRALGFDIVYSMPVMVHVRYRKYADVMLAAPAADLDGERTSGDASRGRGVSVYVAVEDESVDDVAGRAREHGAELSAEPHETPWNTREVALRDPDGYEFVFSEPVDTERSFEDVMGGPAPDDATDESS
nr:VOC family protein [Halorussus sp. JP-T4]